MKRFLFIFGTFCTFSSLFAQITVTNERSINSAFQEYSPAFYGKGLVFVAANPAVDKDKKEDTQIGRFTTSIFLAKRTPDGVLQRPLPFAEELTTKFYDGPMSFNAAGDMVFFTRSNLKKGKPKPAKDGKVKLKIYTALLTNGVWTNITELPFCDGEADYAHPAISADGRRLFFASNRSGGQGGMDLYVSMIQNGIWGEPVNLGPKINTAKDDIFPFSHAGGVLFFSSNGREGVGGLDIFWTKQTPNGWLPPTGLPETINSTSDDFGLVLSDDRTNGYFASNRASGQGDDDIYNVSIPNGLEIMSTSMTSADDDIFSDKSKTGTSKPAENAQNTEGGKIDLLKEKEKIAEANRKEAARIAEEKRKEEARIAEEKRKEEARIAELKRIEEKKLEEAKLAEQKLQASKLSAQKQAEVELAEKKRQEADLAEQKKVQAEIAEQKRKDARIADQKREEARAAEAKREEAALAEKQRLEAKMADKKREEDKIAEKKRAEATAEMKKREDARLAEEKREAEKLAAQKLAAAKLEEQKRQEALTTEQKAKIAEAKREEERLAEAKLKEEKLAEAKKLEAEKLEAKRQEEAKLAEQKRAESQMIEQKREDAKLATLRREEAVLAEKKRLEAKKIEENIAEGKREEAKKQKEAEIVEAKRKETKITEAKREEAEIAEAKRQEVKREEAKIAELKREEAEIAEAKRQEVKREETKLADTKREEAKLAEVKREEAKLAEVKREEAKLAEVKREEAKLAEVKREEAKLAEVKREEVKLADTNLKNQKDKKRKIEKVNSNEAATVQNKPQGQTAEAQPFKTPEPIKTNETTAQTSVSQGNTEGAKYLETVIVTFDKNSNNPLQQVKIGIIPMKSVANAVVVTDVVGKLTGLRTEDGTAIALDELPQQLEISNQNGRAQVPLVIGERYLFNFSKAGYEPKFIVKTVLVNDSRVAALLMPEKNVRPQAIVAEKPKVEVSNRIETHNVYEDNYSQTQPIVSAIAYPENTNQTQTVASSVTSSNVGNRRKVKPTDSNTTSSENTRKAKPAESNNTSSGGDTRKAKPADKQPNFTDYVNIGKPTESNNTSSGDMINPNLLTSTKINTDDFIEGRFDISRTLAEGHSFELHNIYYGYGDAEISDATKTELEPLIALMHKEQDMAIEIAAHTDSRGKAPFNLSLSQLRADNIKSYMVERDISPDRIRSIGFGEAHLKNKCTDNIECTEEEHKVNRRTEIRVIKGAETITVRAKGGIEIQQARTTEGVILADASTNSVKYLADASNEQRFLVVVGTYAKSINAETLRQKAVAAGFIETALVQFQGPASFAVCVRQFNNLKDAQSLTDYINSQKEFEAFIKELK